MNPVFTCSPPPDDGIPPLEAYADEPFAQMIAQDVEPERHETPSLTAPPDDDRLRAAAAALGAELDAEDEADARAMLDPPTPLVRATPPPEPFPLDALGPILAPAARAIAEVVQVPEALAGNSVLAAAALAAQPHANVQTLGGPRPLSLFILTIAGSGDRKTSADSVALTPIREHEREMHKEFTAKLREWNLQQEANKLDLKKARGESEDGAAYRDKLAAVETDPPPRKPWLVCSEPTAEGLVRSLADGQHAQGIFTDEGGQFIGGHGMSEESELRTIAMLSKLWQGDRIDRVRATDREHLTLYGRRLCMHLRVQPDVANRMLGKPLYRSQGFLARWMIAAPESLAGTRLHNPDRCAPEDDPRVTRYWDALGALLGRTANENREVGGLDPPCLALTREARTLLAGAYDEMELAQRKDGELDAIREWASKAAEHACRIAGILTLVADPEAHFVDAGPMAGALALVQHYMGEYYRLLGTTDLPENIRRAVALLEWLRAKRLRSVTARQVTQYGPGRAIRHAAAAKEALRTLAEHGWAATQDNRSYTIHPAAFAEGDAL